ncbi:hypothetical protein BLNAU_24661 [Blattamonas nauphoetae]|uniref:Uncharacterized protein n=1 Tax=Blattamonas nauphoetae TaxID=2049346 RepID=A0ABQ9WLV9_9EUKA|nr:hypothetical protein BLNAU_24661 [Blattamonas nauphoetae]
MPSPSDPYDPHSLDSGKAESAEPLVKTLVTHSFILKIKTSCKALLDHRETGLPADQDIGGAEVARINRLVPLSADTLVALAHSQKVVNSEPLQSPITEYKCIRAVLPRWLVHITVEVMVMQTRAIHWEKTGKQQNTLQRSQMSLLTELSTCLIVSSSTLQGQPDLDDELKS